MKYFHYNLVTKYIVTVTVLVNILYFLILELERWKTVRDDQNKKCKVKGTVKKNNVLYCHFKKKLLKIENTIKPH